MCQTIFGIHYYFKHLKELLDERGRLYITVFFNFNFLFTFILRVQNVKLMVKNYQKN